MEEQFKAYLIDEGYSELTPKGLPSTAHDYPRRVNQVCQSEGYSSLADLAKSIDIIIQTYDVSGVKAGIGEKSHNAVISALKAFRSFIAGEKGIKRRKKSL